MSLNDVPPSLRFGAPEFVFEEDHGAGRDPAAAGRSRVSPYQSWVPASPQIDLLSVAVPLQIFQTDWERHRQDAFKRPTVWSIAHKIPTGTRREGVAADWDGCVAACK